MGEKESVPRSENRAPHGHPGSPDGDRGTLSESNPDSATAEKSVQWEPHKAPGLDTPEQERTQHQDTVKNSIGNIR